MYCLVSSVSRSLFSRMSGLGLNGESEYRRNEASCGVRPALKARSFIKSNNYHMGMVTMMPTLTYGTGRQRENLGAEMSPPGTLLLT